MAFSFMRSTSHRPDAEHLEDEEEEDGEQPMRWSGGVRAFSHLPVAQGMTGNEGASHLSEPPLPEDGLQVNKTWHQNNQVQVNKPYPAHDGGMGGTRKPWRPDEQLQVNKPYRPDGADVEGLRHLLEEAKDDEDDGLPLL